MPTLPIVSDLAGRRYLNRVVLPKRPVILASASPRRREILQQAIQEFEVIPSQLDEDALTVADPWLTASGLARAKAAHIAKNHPDALVIGCDTVVALQLGANDYKQLGKPGNSDEAKDMLAALSGRDHLVITGVSFQTSNLDETRTDTTKVTFRQLDEAEIRTYIESGEPYDKAGGYGIQGAAGQFVEGIEGSITNVIGLPIEMLNAMLEELESAF